MGMLKWLKGSYGLHSQYKSAHMKCKARKSVMAAIVIYTKAFREYSAAYHDDGSELLFISCSPNFEMFGVREDEMCFAEIMGRLGRGTRDSYLAEGIVRLYA